MTFFGDGATSEGDFHEAMNFAGVYRTPTVFVCQNNGWAISMPFAGQTASATIAQKAGAYVMAGELVDGNDLLAVYSAASSAVTRARDGGPTLIEAVTCRIGPHTTADDASRYRSDVVLAGWQGRDPVERVRRFLAGAGAWSEEWQHLLEDEASAEVEAAVAEAEALQPLGPDDVFAAVFADLPADLADQRDRASRGET